MSILSNLQNATDSLAEASAAYANAKKGAARIAAWNRLQEAALYYASEFETYQKSKGT